MKIEPGNVVRVQLFDGRIVEGEVCIGGGIESKSGRKVRIKSADAVVTIKAEQVISILSTRRPPRGSARSLFPGRCKGRYGWA